MNQESRIQKFTDLKAWQEGYALVLITYRLTKHFPADEQFGLKSQMQRAAVSVTSNIAEGFSRDSYTDKKHFYVMARGSLTELQNQSLVARDVGHIDAQQFDNFAKQAVVAHKLLTGLIKSTKGKAALFMIRNS